MRWSEISVDSNCWFDHFVELSFHGWPLVWLPIVWPATLFDALNLQRLALNSNRVDRRAFRQNRHPGYSAMLAVVVRHRCCCSVEAEQMDRHVFGRIQ